MRFLLDTNVVSHIVRYPDGLAATRFGSFAIGVCATSIITAGELAFGLAKRPSRVRADAIAALFAGLDVLPLNPPVEEYYGRLRAYLEAAGTTIGPHDLWIAAHALALDLTIVTANEGEFRRVPDLRVENWLLG